MPDSHPSFPPVPESRVVARRRTSISLVWIIPLVAALAGIWIAVTKILSQGPVITIQFESAEGLEPGKTKIEYNGLEVGKLTAIRLAQDHKHVIATAQMVPKSREFLVRDTKFWVVRPRVSGLNITGLSTLVSGHYIGMELGQSREGARNFVALESPPMVAGNAAGRFFTLKTPELDSLTQGAPIYFRQLQAGQVVSYELDKSGQFLNVRIFIQSPYDRFVTTDTRFWQASGIDMSLTAGGLRLRTESLLSILAGGIAFDTPVTESPAPAAGADTVFTLFDDRAEAFRPPPCRPHSYLLVFKESVRGLTIGAPVTMHGITIGEVTGIRAQFDVQAYAFTVQVTVSMDPERYGVKFLETPPVGDDGAVYQQAMDALVSHGLRAQLKRGNLISGALYVAVDFFPGTEPALVNWSQTPPQLPTLPAAIEGIESGVGNIVRKLEQMPFREIGDDLRKTFGELDRTLATARGTLTNADRLLGSADQLIAPESALDAQLGSLLREMGGAARAIRLLADYLERHPEALIRGKTGEAK